VPLRSHQHDSLSDIHANPTPRLPNILYGAIFIPSTDHFFISITACGAPCTASTMMNASVLFSLIWFEYFSISCIAPVILEVRITDMIRVFSSISSVIFSSGTLPVLLSACATLTSWPYFSAENWQASYEDGCSISVVTIFPGSDSDAAVAIISNISSDAVSEV